MQRIQGISRQAREEFGVTYCFATTAASLAAKQQGIPEFTVQLNSNETGIVLAEFPQPQPLKASAWGLPRRTRYNRLIIEAKYPAPNPLSIFTTAVLGEQEFNIPSNAATPPKDAP